MIHVRSHLTDQPSRRHRKRVWRDAVRRSRLGASLQRRPEPDRRDHHLGRWREAPGTDALGLRLAHSQRAEA